MEKSTSKPETIRITMSPEMQAFIWGARVVDTLGKQAYNKLLKVAETDKERMKEIQKFVNALVEITQGE
tara:strand:+ start:455 stop:661 length:207 start_codon:yes stop_codon:yes gene_type:complete